jgi:serine/threonine protein kinase
MVPPHKTPHTPPVAPGDRAPVLSEPTPNDPASASTTAPEPTTLLPAYKGLMPGGLVGQVFGDFELIQELGRGGMGVVYKAKQRSLDRHVALKLLLGEFASNPQMLSRFLAEARAAASLTHPNIISIYQVGECVVGPYFVMEFIDGPSLESLLTRPLPVPWVAALMTTVAEAVHHAHQKGIIHRDLKPGNIMLQQQKRPMVMDFGIAKSLSRGGNLTSPGAVMGTPAYLSPEQAGEEPSLLGPHSDVYSLGAILYVLLSGRVPFDEGSAMKTILKVISPDPPPLVRTHRPEVPQALEQITMKCLEKEPARRYRTAHALAEDLKRFRATLLANVAPQSARGSLPTLLLIADEGGKQFRLFNASTVIGRAAECDLVLKLPDVSKRHCRVLIGTKGAAVEDLGSVNGTSVNDEPVEAGQRVTLEDGDKLDVAGHVFTVRLPLSP